jgi:hypothetical protein
MFDLIRIHTSTFIVQSEQIQDTTEVVSITVQSPAHENPLLGSFPTVPKSALCAIPSSVDEKPFFSCIVNFSLSKLM